MARVGQFVLAKGGDETDQVDSIDHREKVQPQIGQMLFFDNDTVLDDVNDLMITVPRPASI